MTKKSKLEITFGDLIVALTEETRRHVRDERAAYEVVAHILTGLLSSKSRPRHDSPALTIATFVPGVRPPNQGKAPVSNH